MLYARAAVLAAMALGSATALADDETPPVTGGRTYVQHQIIEARRRHPEIVSIEVEGSGKDGKPAMVLGSTLAPGRVLSPVTGASRPDGVRRVGTTLHVREPFVSSSGHRLGTIDLAYRDRPGAEAAVRRTSAEVARTMARATLSAKNAADPYPFDPKWGPGTYAQRLTDEFVAKHPDLLVMMIHATPPTGGRNIIIGSNIGRFGKAADEDDLRVIDKGSTNLEIGGDGDRFETELPLNDAAGRRIGALGLVFAYANGADKEKLHRHGLAIRDELAAAIPTSAALFRPAR